MSPPNKVVAWYSVYDIPRSPTTSDSHGALSNYFGGHLIWSYKRNVTEMHPLFRRIEVTNCGDDGGTAGGTISMNLA